MTSARRFSWRALVRSRGHYKHSLHLVAVWFFFLAGSAAAEVPVRRVQNVCGEAVLAGAVSVNQAERAALAEARVLAVEQISGIQVDQAWLGSLGLQKAHFLQTMTSGRIVGETVLSKELKAYPQATPEESPVTTFRVCLDAEVALIPPPEDPAFDVAAALNRSAFQSGECAELNVTSSRDAWVYVFNLTVDDAVIPLFPNRRQPDNRVLAKRALTVPAPGCGLRFPVEHFGEEEESAEAFLVIAFTRPVDLAAVFAFGQRYSLSEFYEKLFRFPLQAAAVSLQPYIVRPL